MGRSLVLNWPNPVHFQGANRPTTCPYLHGQLDMDPIQNLNTKIPNSVESAACLASI
jgi:hypothetical protein